MATTSGDQGLVGVGDLAAALHRGHAEVLEVADEPVQHVGAGLVIGVEDHDDLAVGPLERLVERPRLAAAGRPRAGARTLKPWTSGGVAVEQLAGVVGRAVVDEDELEAVGG